MTGRRALMALSVALNLAVIAAVLVVAERRGIALSDLPSLLRRPARVADPGETSAYGASTEDLVRAGRVPVDVVLVGDSHLATLEPHAIWGPGAIVVQRSRGGRTLAGIEAHAATEVLPLQPRRVVLLGGQNDLRFALRDGAEAAAVIREAAAAAARIVAAQRSNGARVILVEPPPVAPSVRSAAAINAAVAGLAERLRDLAATTDGVDWCPWPPGLREGDALRSGIAPDGVHLGPEGRAVLGSAIRAAVEDAGEPGDGER